MNVEVDLSVAIVVALEVWSRALWNAFLSESMGFSNCSPVGLRLFPKVLCIYMFYAMAKTAQLVPRHACVVTILRDFWRKVEAEM